MIDVVMTALIELLIFSTNANGDLMLILDHINRLSNRTILDNSTVNMCDRKHHYSCGVKCDGILKIVMILRAQMPKKIAQHLRRSIWSSENANSSNERCTKPEGKSCNIYEQMNRANFAGEPKPDRNIPETLPIGRALMKFGISVKRQSGTG